jgi:hypothetical protein
MSTIIQGKGRCISVVGICSERKRVNQEIKKNFSGICTEVAIGERFQKKKKRVTINNVANR